MLATLTSADALTWMSILVKALTYATTLVAAGSVLVACALRRLDAEMRRSLARIAVVSALAAAALSLLRFPVRASFLMGGSLDGALDPAILGMVADGPLGTSVTLRLIGLALILAILFPWRRAQWVAAAGAMVVAASFAFRGHALDEPRVLLGLLITVHILGLAFWIGAFAPLAQASARGEADIAGPLAQEFGAKALWVVGALVAAGALTLLLFAGVLALAALNKMYLTRALLAATPGAGSRLRRSIGIEAALVGAILLTTAAVTTVTSPPGLSEQAILSGERQEAMAACHPTRCYHPNQTDRSGRYDT